MSAALLRAAEKPSLYLKPVQSGYPDSDDSAVVEANAKHARGVTLHVFGHPVSPDLAVALEGGDPVADDQLREQTAHGLEEFLGTPQLDSDGPARSMALVETAGGVLSPAPSGTLQADLYRPMRLPALLLGESRLGGVSTTLAAYEALRIRGYDVPAIVFFQENGSLLENEASVQKHVEKDGTIVFQAPHLPPPDVPLAEYFNGPEADKFFLDLYNHLHHVEMMRLKNLQTMQSESKKVFWYPFTQHTQLGKVTCIDSASADEFTCYDSELGIHKMIDGIGSWWTNGVGHGNSDMSKAVGRATGRYGHVTFPEATHEPGFVLAKLLLDGPGKGWAERVFYSDDGSTAVEVALKMAFRKRALDFPDRTSMPLLVVGIEGCYHGDTLGVMDCAPESDYNRSQTPWYQPRGVFFDPPTACIADGVWRIRMPKWTDAEYDIVLHGERVLFDKRRSVPLYDEAIAQRLDNALASGVELGALLIEPVLLGAGGMQIVDPAFHRSLVMACRARGIPIIFDEVFTGLWRLGSISGSQMLGVDPDIAAYGKLLTGGTVPLAATLASEAIFRAFDGDSKIQALLHGHSYTAHPIGCAAGVESFRQYAGLAEGQNYWDADLAREMSCVDGVEQVSVVGTVLAVKMRGEGDGYASTGAREVVQRLAGLNVFARPLGNVVYIMCTPVTPEAVCQVMMRKLFNALAEPSRKESVNESGKPCAVTADEGRVAEYEA